MPSSATAIWSSTPEAHARAELGELPVLDELLAAARATGLEVVEHELSSAEEWDVFEAGWRAGLELIDDPVHRERERKRTNASSYRGVVGFAWLVLTTPGT